jgi:DNA-binding transcriptional ArsR family regulator
MINRKKNQELADSALELIASRFRLLSEPTRLKILHTLGHRELNVTEIVAETGASQANVSKHLAALLDAAVVARRKEGLTANYRVIDPTIFDLCDVVCTRLKDELVERQKLLGAT